MNEKNTFVSEVLLSISLIALLGLIWNASNMSMTDRSMMMVLVILVIIFALFSGFVWKESARDEREDLHRLLAGKFAFLAGSAVLVIGIITQTVNHTLDFWLVLTLSVMLVSKMMALIYGKLRR